MEENVDNEVTINADQLASVTVRRKKEMTAEQAEKLPNGTLGFIIAPKVEIVTRDAEVLTLWNRYMRGELTTIELAGLLEHLKQDRLTATVPKIEIKP